MQHESRRVQRPYLKLMGENTFATSPCSKCKSRRGMCSAGFARLGSGISFIQTAGKRQSRGDAGGGKRLWWDSIPGWRRHISPEVVNLTTAPPLGMLTYHSGTPGFLRYPATHTWRATKLVFQCFALRDIKMEYLPNVVEVGEDLQSWVLGYTFLYVGHLDGHS